MTEARVVPVESRVDHHSIDGLDPNTYTAHRLKHSSPDHLHLTTRRFFIGPIPEGWLNSNRKSWYKRRLELSNYSSRQATFTATSGQVHHHRTLTGLDGPSTAARLGFSFPQPEDANDSAEEANASDQSGNDSEEEEDEEEEGTDVETRAIEPVATKDIPQLLGIVDREEPPKPKMVPIPADRGLDGIEDQPLRLNSRIQQYRSESAGQESFITAREQPSGSFSKVNLAIRPPPIDNRISASSTGNSYMQSNGFDGMVDGGDNTSRTALIPSNSPEIQPQLAKTMTGHDPTPMEPGSPRAYNKRRQSGVRFKDAVADRQDRVEGRVRGARNRVASRLSRRNTLREGTIIKMERMLVRADVTLQTLPDEFDENESMKTETKIMEKWQEFMVVARKSKREDAEDFRLQFYKTRVIPEIEDESTRKKPQREVKLIRKSTHVNMYSSLDKTLVIWHPYRKGTRIIIMKATSTAHSVEWYTFLRDALGWRRPPTLQVSVPDLGVSLHIDKPFEGLEVAGAGAQDEQTAMAQTVAAEQAVAGKIITQCVEMLEGNPEWADVMRKWTETARMGLAWKHYDRLEWVHGVNEQKMYGSMAMQNSYDLELRPKHHYPTTTFGKKGVEHEEPAPIEGFLIRLTSQKGVHRRMGKAFFKRLYFTTQNQFLVFNRPAKATPPHPPRLTTITGQNIPSSSEIVENTPMMYDIQPFETENHEIKWLKSGRSEVINSHDRAAGAEARRNVANVTESDGYVDMCHIRKVRHIKWGANETDDNMDSGSDVDFHMDVENTHREDGVTSEIDDNRIFELLLDNGLVIRLQAYDRKTRDEWMKRMKQLVKYWKLRCTADMNAFKSVRSNNLHQLNIDEEQEAELGQFGRKWEVSRSEASPELYNICPIGSCRTITMAGTLYRKARRHATFHRCGVLLTGGKLMIYEATVRKATGAQVPHIHHERQQIVELNNCYIYSGLIVEDDLLYQNRTFDANHMGVMASLPRVWTDDGWTSSDVDSMCCFVIWINDRKGWFRSPGISDNTDGRRARLKRVGQLGVPGRGMVFKCRSRAERDLWVLNVATEIERVVERQAWEDGNEVRFTS